jgi:hypothetical protein
MKRQRKVASERQITYANAMATALGFEQRFNDGDTAYDVSKFLREHEHEYKDNVNKQLASPRQIDYANTISDILHLGVEFDSSSLSSIVNDFISKNKELYDETWRRKTFVNGNSYEYEDFDGKLRERFPLECREFMYENLYGVHGVYAFVDNKGSIVYIGKSVNLAQRIPSSYRERSTSSDIRSIFYYADNNIANVNVLEIVMISKYKPKLNSDCNTLDNFTLFDCDIDISNFEALKHFNAEKGGGSNE